MIASLTGTLEDVDDDRIQLRVGPIVYEALIPAADVAAHRSAQGAEVTLHTVFYLEGDSSGGNLEPRLLAFLHRDDKRFFERFITVKGIGPKKALRALIHPGGQLARAIEQKDTRFLSTLPQIGKRTAEQIVAELFGKVSEFAAAFDGRPPTVETRAERRSAAEEDAIAALMALGERRSEAEALLERSRTVVGEAGQSNDLVREMLRLRAVRQ